MGALAEPLAMSFAGASKHVKVLEQAGLIERTIEGRQHRCRLRAATLEPASAWLRRYERYWTDRLDALEDLIARSRATADVGQAAPTHACFTRC